ncbi:MAG: hypothetical protein JWQ94_3972 [Tardiphaga sp.]|jgi:hypothetical protein|nr:hypothetical protein [Tardiphaga sp.]
MTDDTFIDANPGMAERGSHSAKSTAKSAAETGAMVGDMFCAAVDKLTSVVEDARRPGKPLDTVAKLTRDAPLGALFVAFLVGVAVARRR